MPETSPKPDVLIVGGGVMGAAAALELRARGASVTIVDPGPLPHPDAASTDISKLVRADYGKDVFYTELMEAALPAWRAWNARFGAELFHETGLLVLSTGPLEAGSFERESFDLLIKRGHVLERLDTAAIRARFPAWGDGAYADGYFNANGGWAESGRVVRALLEECARAGVVLREGVRVRPIATTTSNSRPSSEAQLQTTAEQRAGAPATASPSTSILDHIVTESGERLEARTIVVAAGAFTPFVLPELADRIAAVGQAVLHFAPADAALFSSPSFPPWAADIARTGWYGFPHHEGVVKVANHGRGVVVDPAAPRAVPAGAEEKFRAFFARALPGLQDAPHVRSRLCLYSDTFDGDFFIDRHPEIDGLVVASGGSGHAFKFGPVLGAMIADRVENKGNGEWRNRFAWRAKTERRLEAARYAGEIFQR